MIALHDISQVRRLNTIFVGGVVQVAACQIVMTSASALRSVVFEHVADEKSWMILETLIFRPMIVDWVGWLLVRFNALANESISEILSC